MNRSITIWSNYLIVQLRITSSIAQNKIIVDANGKGRFTTIQETINSLPDSSISANTIYIKKGTYHEKIFIAKHNIIFEGEDREKTIIIQNIARDECGENDFAWYSNNLPYGIKANDITLNWLFKNKWNPAVN